jgi:hypothetical protein
VTPRTLAAFRGPTLVLPNVTVLGEPERRALEAQLSRGVHLVVTGTGASTFAASSRVSRFPDCPGRAYLQAVERDFENGICPTAEAFLAALSPDTGVRIEAPPSVLTQTARVDGELHVFFANFSGLAAGKSAVQVPQSGIRVRVASTTSGRAWFLPFLGEARAIEGEVREGARVFDLPEIRKGAVFWIEARQAVER